MPFCPEKKPDARVLSPKRVLRVAPNGPSEKKADECDLSSKGPPCSSHWALGRVAPNGLFGGCTLSIYTSRPRPGPRTRPRARHRPRDVMLHTNMIHDTLATASDEQSRHIWWEEQGSFQLSKSVSWALHSGSLLWLRPKTTTGVAGANFLAK